MNKLIKFFAAAAIALSSCAASANVIISNVNATSSNISFDVNGTITTMGDWFTQQIAVGQVTDPSLAWITSFNSGVVTSIGATKQAVTSLYALSGIYGVSVWSISDSNWALGDTLNVHYNLVGNFDLSKFSAAAMGLQIGYSGMPAVDARLNLAPAGGTVAAAAVPEPGSIVLLALGLAGLALARRKQA